MQELGKTLFSVCHVLNMAEPSRGKRRKLYLDSGASSHLRKNADDFAEISDVNQGTLYLAIRR